MPQIFLNILNIITPWLYDHGIKIAAIIIVAYAIRKFAVNFIEKMVAVFAGRPADSKKFYE